MHDHQAWPLGQQRRNGPGDAFNQVARIGISATIKHDALMSRQAIIGGAQRMLASQNEAQPQVAPVKRGGDGC